MQNANAGLARYADTSGAPSPKTMMPIKDLISADLLRGYSESGLALVTIMDADGLPVGGLCDQDLCRVFAQTGRSSTMCGECPIQLGGHPVSGNCVPALARTLPTAPVLFARVPHHPRPLTGKCSHLNPRGPRESFALTHRAAIRVAAPRSLH